jgi:hypothetical protein
MAKLDPKAPARKCDYCGLWFSVVPGRQPSHGPYCCGLHANRAAFKLRQRRLSQLHPRTL